MKPVTRQLPRLVDLLASQGMYSGQALVSAEEASILITTYNVGNRRLRAALIDYLHSQIKTGEWQGDHPTPIVFSDAGRLIDGQHRLLAIAKGGVEVVVNVLIGARDDLRRYLDTGISRSLGDRITFVEGDLALNDSIAQLINVAWWIQSVSSGRNRPTPDEAREYFEAHSPALIFAGAYKNRKQRGVASAPAMVALLEMHERDSARAEDFAEDMFNPNGVIPQARRLREYLLTSSSYKGPHSLQRYRKSVFCMKAHLEGRVVIRIVASRWD